MINAHMHIHFIYMSCFIIGRSKPFSFNFSSSHFQSVCEYNFSCPYIKSSNPSSSRKFLRNISKVSFNSFWTSFYIKPKVFVPALLAIGFLPHPSQRP